MLKDKTNQHNLLSNLIQTKTDVRQQKDHQQGLLTSPQKTTEKER